MGEPGQYLLSACHLSGQRTACGWGQRQPSRHPALEALSAFLFCSDLCVEIGNRCRAAGGRKQAARNPESHRRCPAGNRSQVRLLP
jgi:hypothetical protein